MTSNMTAFRDPNSDDETVLRAASQIGLGSVPAQFWSDIANSSSHRAFHRAVAAYELFRRHLGRPSTLKQAATLLAGGRWLQDAVIEKIETLGGEIPVVVPAGGAAFVIRFPKDEVPPLSEMGIYLAVERNLDPRLLRDALMSKANDPSLDQTRILDFALFPE